MNAGSAIQFAGPFLILKEDKKRALPCGGALNCGRWIDALIINIDHGEIKVAARDGLHYFVVMNFDISNLLLCFLAVHPLTNRGWTYVADTEC